MTLLGDWTRDQYESQILDLLDATGSTRYSTTLIRNTFDAVYGRGWRRILNANNVYRWQPRAVTTNADGGVAFSALDGTPTGDNLQRTYKILAAAKGTQRYTRSDYFDNPLANVGTPGQPGPLGPLNFTFQKLWGTVYFYPLTGGAPMTVWVNHVPQRPSQLSAGSIIVEWPKDYEMVMVYEVASRIAAKGVAETDATIWFQQLADDLWKDLLLDVQRETTDPLIVQAADNSDDWTT